MLTQPPSIKPPTIHNEQTLTSVQKQNYLDAQRMVDETIQQLAQKENQKAEELKALLSNLNSRLDCYPKNITGQLEETKKLCKENEEKIDTFIALYTKPLSTLKEKNELKQKNKELNLENKSTNFQRRIASLEQNQSNFFKCLGIGTTLTLLYYLWSYTQR